MNRGFREVTPGVGIFCSNDLIKRSRDDSSGRFLIKLLNDETLQIEKQTITADVAFTYLR